MSESSTEYEGYRPRRSYRAEMDELLNTHRDRVVLVDPTSGPESEQFSDHEIVAEGDDIRDIEIAAEEMTVGQNLLRNEGLGQSSALHMTSQELQKINP